MRYLIGIGNYTLGDDGIGLQLIEHIARENLDRNFQAIDLSDDGTRLLNFFEEGTERILLVDCVQANRKPGDFFFFKPDDVESEKLLGRMTTHEGDILKVIQLGKQLGYPQPPLLIMGIEPESMKTGDMQLSTVLRERFPEYLAAALEKLEQGW